MDANTELFILLTVIRLIPEAALHALAEYQLSKKATSLNI